MLAHLMSDVPNMAEFTEPDRPLVSPTAIAAAEELDTPPIVFDWDTPYDPHGWDVSLAITPGGRVGDASPLGKPGGPRKLTDYTREIAHALMRHGHSRSSAIAIARAAQSRWARGGGKVRPQVRAAAAKSTVEQHALDHVPTGHRHANDGDGDIGLSWAVFDAARREGKMRSKSQSELMDGAIKGHKPSIAELNRRRKLSNQGRYPDPVLVSQARREANRRYLAKRRTAVGYVTGQAALATESREDLELAVRSYLRDPRGRFKGRGVSKGASRTKAKLPKARKPHEREQRTARLAQEELARRMVAKMGYSRGRLAPLPGARREFANDVEFGIFDEALHPRGPNGKWIPKGSPAYKQAVAAVKQARRQGNETLAKNILAGKAKPGGGLVRAAREERGKRLIAKRRAIPSVAGHPRGKKLKNDAQFEAHYREHVAHVDRTLQSKATLAKASDKVHAREVTLPDGTKTLRWNRARRKIQQQIVSDVLQKAIAGGAKRDKKAIFLGGLPGAGKTNALDKIPGMNKDHYVNVNPDIFKEELAKRGLIPNVKGLSPMEASSLNHEESSTMARMLADEARRQGLNVIWDITMNKASSVTERHAPLKESGYKTHAMFVDIPHSESADRVKRRHQKGYQKQIADRSGRNLGQRFVPSGHTASGQSTHGSTSANRDAFDEVKNQFDSYELRNNFNGDPNQFPLTLVESKGSFKG